MKRSRDHQVCTKCVMDTTDSSIVFDKNGVCDHCNTYLNTILPDWQNGKGREKQIDYIISKIKKEGNKKDFDCIMGMSGGIDSSFLLYTMVSKYALRPLVFHVDAGWNSQIAVNNIERLVDGLGLDLYTEVINWEEIKDLQLSFFKSGGFISISSSVFFTTSLYKLSRFSKRAILFNISLDFFPYLDWFFSDFDFSK